MTEKKKSGKKVSPKKQRRSSYKWAKVLGWEIEELRKRLDELEKTVKYIKEQVEKIVNGEVNEE